MAGSRQKLVTDVVVDSSQATRGLKDLGQAADRAGVDVEQLAKELKTSERTIRDAGDTADRTGDRIGDAFDNTKDSGLGAASALGEAFGSGGSAADALGSMGEVVESVAESFGPWGGAIAVAGGAIIGMFAAASKKAEELKQRAQEVFDALVEGSGVLDEAFRKQAIADFIKNNEELVEQVGQLLGPRGLKDLGDAVSGDQEAYQKLNREVETRLAQMKRESNDLAALVQSGTPLTQQQRQRLELLNDQIPVYEDLNTKIDEQAGAVENATGMLSLYNGMTSTATQLEGNYTQALKDTIEQLKLKAKYPGTTITQTGTGQRGIKAGERAAGGPVSAGTPYVVGEYGKELFVPAQNGTIVPGVPSAAPVTVYQTIVSNDPVRVAQQTASALRRQRWRTGGRG